MRDDLNVLESIFGEAVAGPFRQLAIARRAGHVRLVGEVQVRRADTLRRRQFQKPTLDRRVSGRAREHESGRRRSGCLQEGSRDDEGARRE